MMIPHPDVRTTIDSTYSTRRMFRRATAHGAAFHRCPTYLTYVLRLAVLKSTVVPVVRPPLLRAQCRSVRLAPSSVQVRAPQTTNLDFLYDDSSDRLYMATFSPPAVRVFDSSDLSSIDSIPAPGPLQSQGHWQVGQMAITGGTTLWAAGHYSGVVWKFNLTTGAVIGNLSSALVTRPWSLLVRATNSEIVLGDLDSGRLVAFLRRLESARCVDEPCRLTPWSIAAVSSRATANLYVINSAVNEVWTFNSELCWTGTLVSLPSVVLPRSLAVDSDGLVYVADRSQGRLLVFDSSGASVASYPDRLSNSIQIALAVDVSGYRVFMLSALPGPSQYWRITEYAGPKSKSAPVCSSDPHSAMARSDWEQVEDFTQSAASLSHTATHSHHHGSSTTQLQQRIQQLEADIATLRKGCNANIELRS